MSSWEGGCLYFSDYTSMCYTRRITERGQPSDPSAADVMTKATE